MWAPKWVPGQPEKKRDPFEVMARFGGLQVKEEVFAEGVTDLSGWLRDRLEAKTAEGKPIVLIAADPADEEAVLALASLLQGIGPRVLPVRCDEALALQAGGIAAGVVVWGAAGLAAVDACVAGLKAKAPALCLVLPGGDEAVKRRFFREGVIAPRLPALPADAQAARALLEGLGLLPSRKP